MIKLKWRDVLEAGGLLAVVLSLVFLALQIRQEQQLTRSELGAESAEVLAGTWMIALESGFQKTYVKMITEPTLLSDEEMVEASFFLGALQQSIVRECYLAERGVFDECNVMADGILQNYFANEFAKNWWEQESRANQYLPDWVDDAVKNLDAKGSWRRLAGLKASLQ